MRVGFGFCRCTEILILTYNGAMAHSHSLFFILFAPSTPNNPRTPHLGRLMSRRKEGACVGRALETAAKRSDLQSL